MSTADRREHQTGTRERKTDSGTQNTLRSDGGQGGTAPRLVYQPGEVLRHQRETVYWFAQHRHAFRSVFHH
jgi:hypothetical protein